MRFATVFLDAANAPTDNLDKATGHITVAADQITADNKHKPLYDAEQHGNILFCGDFQCAVEHETRVTFVKEGKVKLGGNIKPRAHFRTLPRQEHRHDCPMPRDYPEFEGKLTISKKEAIEKGFPILVLFSPDIGDPNYGAYSNIFTWLESKSRLKGWMDNHRHATVSVASLPELWSELKKLKAEPKYNFNKTMIGHCVDYASIEEFNVGASAQNVFKLFENMLRQSNEVVHGFPRYVQLKPLSEHFKSANSAKNSPVKAQSFMVDNNGNRALKLQHIVTFADASIRSAFLKHAAQDVVAIPKINMAQLRNADNSFKQGYSATYELTWHLVSKDQFTPTQKAQKQAAAKNAVQGRLFDESAPGHP